jgi:hypothetical protein
VKKSLDTTRRYQWEKTPARQTAAFGTSSQASSGPSSVPSLDEEEDSEHKRIRWETPTTHRYQLADKPRLLEEKFLNVLDSVQSNMVCSQHFERPLLNGNVWNLLDPNRNGAHDSGGSSKVGSRTYDSNSQDPYSDDVSADESIFEDGPSVVEITDHPPIVSDSMTASESLLSNSHDSDEENRDDRSNSRNNRHYSRYTDEPPNASQNPPADCSQILDDLSGMESERHSEKREGIEYDNSPHKFKGDVVALLSHDARPPAKIYNTSGPLPCEDDKEKSCILSIGKLQGMQKTRVTPKKNHVTVQLGKLALRRKSKGSTLGLPITDICIGDSNEISTMSASEDSYTYQSRNKSIDLLARPNNQQRTTLLHTRITPAHRGLRLASNSSLLFDVEAETKSCIPNLLQRKRIGDTATTSNSSKSLGLRLLSKSGDAPTSSEKNIEATTRYIYEYDSGVNTYVAYFDVGKPNESRAALQVIEHPNPPLLPFGSSEVVVKIEVSVASEAFGFSDGH